MDSNFRFILENYVVWKCHETAVKFVYFMAVLYSCMLKKIEAALSDILCKFVTVSRHSYNLCNIVVKINAINDFFKKSFSSCLWEKL